MSWCARGSLLAGTLVLSLIVAGCGPSAPAAEKAGGSPAPLRAGDSLLGSLDRAVVERYPPSNLSPVWYDLVN